MAHQVPEWEGVPPSWKRSYSSKSSPANPPKESGSIVPAPALPRLRLQDRFDAFLPPHRRYLGRGRRTFLLIVLAVFLCLLALILGLAIGLSRRKSSPANLPLPSNTATFTGDLTYYGTGLGACGIVSQDTDFICAVSEIVFDAASTSSNPNLNPLCGREIRIQRFDESVGTNVSIDVTVVDRCVACQPEDLDLSPLAFSKLADQALGRVKGTWAWLQ